MKKRATIRSISIPRSAVVGAPAQAERPRLVFGLLCIVLLIGLALRAVYLYQAAHQPDFSAPILDPQLNDYWARALVAGEWHPPAHADDPQIASTPYGRPPAYPYLLALVYWLGGGSFLVPRLVQMAIGVLNALLAYWLGRRIFGRSSGLAAAALMSVYWGFIYFEGELNYPVYAVSLTLAILLCLARWYERPAWPASLAVGALVGFMALFRPNALLLVPALALWMLWMAWHARASWKRALLSAALLVVACTAVIAPALVRNYRVSHEFFLISYYGGVNAYIGNNPESDGASPRIPDIQEIAGMDNWNCFNYPQLVRGLGMKLGKPDLTFSEASSYFYRRARDFIVQHPAQAVRLTFRKALLFWGPAEVSDSKVVHYERQHSILRYLPGFPLALASAILGLTLIWTGKRRAGKSPDPLPARQSDMSLLIVLVALTYFVSVLPFFISGRYRIPIVPCLLLLGGHGLAQTLQYFFRRDFLHAATCLFWGAALYVAASLPLAHYTPDASKWHFHRAIACTTAGDQERAMDELNQALRINPDNAEAHLYLGFLFQRQSRSDEALEQYEEAVRAKPGYALAHNNLGYQLELHDRLPEAEQRYRKAIELNPLLTLAYTNLGNLLLDQGRPVEAEAAYRSILETNPADPHVHYNLGNALKNQDRIDEAVKEYEQALEQNPDDPNIPNNLGLALLQLGRTEEAMQRFEEAARRGPEYANAYFNLGNLYGNHGQFDKAIPYLEKALELDPEFTLAQQVLDQVRAAQGPEPPIDAADPR